IAAAASPAFHVGKTVSAFSRILSMRLIRNSMMRTVLLSAHVEMMGFLGAGNNPMVGMTVAVAVAVQEAMSK
ncbi:MAG: GGGtGRT protein, partial [Solobacterium sp.]|nr:GGGtGRT protein [Solobacterium sp.]